MGSAILGQEFFISDISGMKTDKEIPALKEMADRVSVDVIYKEVEDIISDDPVLKGNIKIYLAKSCTGKRLKETGEEFGIGKSGVSQTCRHLSQRIDLDKKNKTNIDKILKGLNLSKMKT